MRARFLLNFFESNYSVFTTRVIPHEFDNAVRNWSGVEHYQCMTELWVYIYLRSFDGGLAPAKIVHYVLRCLFMKVTFCNTLNRVLHIVMRNNSHDYMRVVCGCKLYLQDMFAHL